MILEICTASVDGCQAAQNGGADRIELNSALELGGLTPTLGTLMEALKIIKIPIIVMIRPRSGGFCYSKADFEAIQRDVDLVLENGATGIAFGILTSNGTLDVERNRILIQQAKPHETVFHRAFDVVPNPMKTMEQLIELGVTRILTSGQEQNAIDGAETITRLMEHASNRIEILPGGGISPENVSSVIQQTGCNQVHASLSFIATDNSVRHQPHLTFKSEKTLLDRKFITTDGTAVTKMRKIIDAHKKKTGE